MDFALSVSLCFNEKRNKNVSQVFCLLIGDIDDNFVERLNCKFLLCKYLLLSILVGYTTNLFPYANLPGAKVAVRNRHSYSRGSVEQIKLSPTPGNFLF